MDTVIKKCTAAKKGQQIWFHALEVSNAPTFISRSDSWIGSQLNLKVKVSKIISLKMSSSADTSGLESYILSFFHFHNIPYFCSPPYAHT